MTTGALVSLLSSRKTDVPIFATIKFSFLSDRNLTSHDYPHMSRARAFRCVDFYVTTLRQFPIMFCVAVHRHDCFALSVDPFDSLAEKILQFCSVAPLRRFIHRINTARVNQRHLL